jgi:hypothetical protein
MQQRQAFKATLFGEGEGINTKEHLLQSYGALAVLLCVGHNTKWPLGHRTKWPAGHGLIYARVIMSYFWVQNLRLM